MDDQDQENYCIIKSNKSSIRNSQNLFVNQGIIQIKVSIVNQQKMKKQGLNI